MFGVGFFFVLFYLLRTHFQILIYNNWIAAYFDQHKIFETQKYITKNCISNKYTFLPSVGKKHELFQGGIKLKLVSKLVSADKINVFFLCRFL